MSRKRTSAFTRYPPPGRAAKQLIRQSKRRGVELPEKQIRCAQTNVICRYLSCPICRFKFRKAVKAAAGAYFASARSVDWATIVPAQGRVSFEDLPEFDVPKFQRLINRKLANVLPPGRVVIGYLDVSVNLHNNAGKHLQFHHHLFIHPPLSDVEKGRVRQAFGHPGAYRPVVFVLTLASGLLGKLEYTFKWFFERRSTFDGNRLRPDGRPCRPGSKSQPLQAAEAVALSAALAKYPVGELLFLMGLKRKRTGSADPFNIVLMPSGRRK